MFTANLNIMMLGSMGWAGCYVPACARFRKIKKFLGRDATAVKVFCKDKETEGEFIAKLITIISKETLLERV